MYYRYITRKYSYITIPKQLYNIYISKIYNYMTCKIQVNYYMYITLKYNYISDKIPLYYIYIYITVVKISILHHNTDLLK